MHRKVIKRGPFREINSREDQLTGFSTLDGNTVVATLLGPYCGKARGG